MRGLLGFCLESEKKKKEMIVVKSWKKMGNVGYSLGKLEEKRDGV